MALQCPKSGSEDVLSTLEHLLRSQSDKTESVHDTLVKLGAPIVSIAIMDAGTISAKLFGSPSRDPASPEATTLNDDTLFQAASISKSMTAMAVLKLCQEETLNLDVPISQYLSHDQISWISTPRTYTMASCITLRQLLSHMSGLSCCGFPGYPNSPIPTTEQILRGEPPANNIPVTVDFVPGTRFSYSGGGFTVVQLVLETHLRKPFHEIMHETLFSPLEMSRSTFQLLPTREENYASSYWNGKVSCEPGHHAQPEAAAAGLWTTPSDLLRAVYAAQRSLKSGDFLEQKWARIMLTEVEDNGMALGWCAAKDGNNFWHTGGNDPGYRCIVVGYANLSDIESKSRSENYKVSIPDGGGICVMTSSAAGDVIRDKLVAAMASLKGWPMPTDVAPIVPLIDRRRSVTVAAKEWCGRWTPGLWELKFEDGFSVNHGTSPSIPLLVAAIPSHPYDEGNSIDLAADGLSMMLRLGWKDGTRIVEIWQDGDIVTLNRHNISSIVTDLKKAQ